MLPSDGKTVMCIKKPGNLSHRIVHVPREALSGLRYRGIFDVITA